MTSRVKLRDKIRRFIGDSSERIYLVVFIQSTTTIIVTWLQFSAVYVASDDSAIYRQWSVLDCEWSSATGFCKELKRGGFNLPEIFDFVKINF